VKTAEGTMIVHVPPESLQNVHEGDTITVNLTLKGNAPASKKTGEKK
jgi:hypothetical protein